MANAEGWLDRVLSQVPDAVVVDPSMGVENTDGPDLTGAIVVVDAEPGCADFRTAGLVDGVAAVIVKPLLADRLRRGGSRCLVIGSEQGQLDEAGLHEVRHAKTQEQAPALANNRLTAKPGQKRYTELAGPAWSRLEASEMVDGGSSFVPSGWDDYLAGHRDRFVETFALVPAAPTGARALDVSAFPLSIRLLTQLGYWTAGTIYAEDAVPQAFEASDFWADAGMQAQLRFEAELNRLPCDDEIFDFVLAAEIIEHLPTDPMQLLVELNRVLRHGGQLLLTTPNLISQRALSLAMSGEHPFNYPFFDRNRSMDRHHLEYTPNLLVGMARSAGFAIRSCFTADVWWPPDDQVMAMLENSGYSTDQRGDNIFLLAEKVSSLVDVSPPEIYTGSESEYGTSYRNEPRRHLGGTQG